MEEGIAKATLAMSHLSSFASAERRIWKETKRQGKQGGREKNHRVEKQGMVKCER